MDSYLKKYIANYNRGLTFLPLIEDCLYYSPSSRTKFDGVVAAGLCELYDESLFIENIVASNPNRDNEILPRYIYKTIGGRKIKVKETTVDGEMIIKDIYGKKLN